jgi:hypothetical protein
MVVTCDNRAREEINMRSDVPKGGESRTIDLRGNGKQTLKKVASWYTLVGPAERQDRGQAAGPALMREARLR